MAEVGLSLMGDHQPGVAVHSGEEMSRPPRLPCTGEGYGWVLVLCLVQGFLVARHGDGHPPEVPRAPRVLGALPLMGRFAGFLPPCHCLPYSEKCLPGSFGIPGN